MAKWDRKERQEHEKKVLRDYGFKPRPGSGNQWHSKEDGERPMFLCQLKSTKNNSITLKKEDLLTLAENAALENRIGVFVVDFVGCGSESNMRWFAFLDIDALPYMDMLDEEEEAKNTDENITE